MITPFPKSALLKPGPAPAEESARKRPDPALLADLRARIRRLEQGGAAEGEDSGLFTLGADEIDAALPRGGLVRAALHEIIGPPGAASGFCAALLHRLGAPLTHECEAVLWCRWRHDLYGPGLAAMGLDPSRLVLVRGRRDTDILWAMEEGLRSGVPAAVIGDAATPAPIALRRLQLAAETGGVTGFLMQAALRAEHGASPAMTRWRVTPLPGGFSGGFTDPLTPRWRLELLRCRGGRPGAWDVCWHGGRTDSGAGTFKVLAPALVESAPAAIPVTAQVS